MERIFTALAALFTLTMSCDNQYLQPVAIDTDTVKHDVTLAEDGAPATRTYSYTGPVPVTFTFTENNATITAGNNFRKDAAGIFLDRKQLQAVDSLYAARRFEIDSVNFTSEYTDQLISRMAQVSKNGRQYLIFECDKHKTNITPFESYFYYIFDVTDKDAVTGTGFVASAAEANQWPIMWYGGNGLLHVQCNYWSPDDKTTHTLWLEQNENKEWFPSRTVLKDTY